jgi:hypothetical protein
MLKKFVLLKILTQPLPQHTWLIQYYYVTNTLLKGEKFMMVAIIRVSDIYQVFYRSSKLTVDLKAKYCFI